MIGIAVGTARAFNKAIPHYEKVLANLPRDEMSRNNYLRQNNMESGLCFYFRLCPCDNMDILLVDIQKILVDMKKPSHLCVCPAYETFEIAKEALQVRIDVMKKYTRPISETVLQA